MMKKTKNKAVEEEVVVSDAAQEVEVIANQAAEEQIDETLAGQPEEVLTDEAEHELYQEAQEVVKELLDSVLAESGILDEPKEVMTTRNRIAADVFASSCVDVLYFTSDAVPFFAESDAVRHAATLANGTVVTVKRK